MPAQLVALNDGPNILLDKPILLLGRHPECDIQIDSRKISRRHCCIAQVSNYFVVRDLGSTNGIRINGVRVLEGRLAVGDELTIGSHRFQVAWDSMPPGSKNQGRQRPKEAAAPPRPPAAIPDDQLESCDEPVPLAESDSIPPSPPRRPPTSPEIPESPPLPLPDKESSRIVPDHLELAPGSDVHPSLEGHPSGSHHPS